MDQETNGGLKDLEVCDNIDLEMVLMEYESYHYVKFQKYPKVIRTTAPAGRRCLVSAALRPLPVPLWNQSDSLVFPLVFRFIQKGRTAVQEMAA